MRGVGLMAAVEIVADGGARTPDVETAGRVHAAAYRAGVFVRWSGTNLVVSPPLTIEADDVDLIVSALDRALGEAA